MLQKEKTTQSKGRAVIVMNKKKKRNESRPKQSIEKYLEEIGGYSPLTPDQEISLAKKIKRGDDIALDKLVKANQMEREKVEILPSGYGIHWLLIDENLCIDGLLGIK